MEKILVQQKKKVFDGVVTTITAETSHREATHSTLTKISFVYCVLKIPGFGVIGSVP